MKAIINATIYDFDQYKEDMYVLFDSKIVEVGKMDDFIDHAYEIIDGKGMLLMPGLINGHTHIYSAFSRGMSVPFNPNTFQDILDQFWWKLDAQLDNEANYYSGIIHGTEAARCGVTTLIDHHASGLSIKGSLEAVSTAVSKDVGLRGIYCFETSDRFDVDACIEENINFNEHTIPKLTAGLFGMHASMSLSEDSLLKIKNHIGTMPIHIHVAESQMDETKTLERYGLSIIHRLENYGLLNKNSLLAHCIYIDQDSARIIHDHECYVALNPTSNMNNGVGLPDIDLLDMEHVNVILGNDGMSAGITTDWQNILYTMHLKYHSPLAYDLERLRKSINLTYEYAMGLLRCQIGKIRPDYEADLLLVPYDPPTPMNKDNIMGHLFYGLFSAFKPRYVWSQGKSIVKDYSIDTGLMDKRKEAIKVARKVWNRL